MMGISPMRYLAKWRIQTAQDLLANTKLSLLQIALKVAYKSASSLSKKFKIETGQSPGEYRKNSEV